jgi:hypothetical protein
MDKLERGKWKMVGGMWSLENGLIGKWKIDRFTET